MKTLGEVLMWLWNREEITKRLRVEGEYAFVEAEGGILCDDNDIPVLEPDV